ncbi:hypothetical protein CR513_43862, partial [Mucuna pruriens]
MGIERSTSLSNNHQNMSRLEVSIKKLFMGGNKPHEHGVVTFKPIFYVGFTKFLNKDTLFVRTENEDFKKSMMDEFEMIDFGMMYRFFGIEMIQTTIGIFLCQKRCVGEVLDKYQMKDCNLMNTPL